MIHYQDRWAVVTGASSGLGRGLAARLADRGMSLVLTGRNEARLDEAADQIRRAAPRVKVETVAADLSTRSGVSALLDHVGDRPIEVLVNNAGFGSYGPFAEADPDREADEVAVDVSAVITLARAFLPGMLARRSGGILNVASAIAFQPAPYQAVYGASKAFVLSFSEALWAEARAAGVAVTALCPGPTRTGFVDALGRRCRPHGDLQPARRAGARHRGRAAGAGQGPGRGHPRRAEQSDRRRRPVHAARVAHPGLRPAAPPGQHGLPATDRGSQRDRDSCLGRTRVGSVDRRRTLAVVVSGLPMGSSRVNWQCGITGAARPVSFRWKAHPVELRSTVVAADRPHSFAIVADARGLHAERTFTLRPTPDGLSTVVVSHETQVGLLPRLGRVFLAPRLRAANQAMFDDLARAAGHAAATPATPQRRDIAVEH